MRYVVLVLAAAVIASVSAAQDPRPIRLLDLKGKLPHVQGIDLDDRHLWVTSVDAPARKGYLAEFALPSGEHVRSIELQDGPRFHPGGIAADADSIWIPVAEYRRQSSAVIQRRDKRTFAVKQQFEVADHIGCVAVNQDVIVGGNWDSRDLYVWDRSGKLLNKIANPTVLARIPHEELEQLFRSYSETGNGKRRRYLHDPVEAAPYQQEPGTFTPWEALPEGTDMLFYEGLHGAVQTPEVDIARYPDLLIGVVPVINLEWIQKLYRDKNVRGYSAEAVTDTILRRMPDYVNFICPQFTHTHVNFQRVPVVDTSNPFVARDIPSADESVCVIRFANPKGIDFPYLLNMINNSWMSRANTLVVPGGKMELAMQLIFTPYIWRMMERRKRALGAL